MRKLAIQYNLFVATDFPYILLANRDLFGSLIKMNVIPTKIVQISVTLI